MKRNNRHYPLQQSRDLSKMLEAWNCSVHANETWHICSAFNDTWKIKFSLFLCFIAAAARRLASGGIACQERWDERELRNKTQFWIINFNKTLHALCRYDCCLFVADTYLIDSQQRQRITSLIATAALNTFSTDKTTKKGSQFSQRANLVNLLNPRRRRLCNY